MKKTIKTLKLDSSLLETAGRNTPLSYFVTDQNIIQTINRFLFRIPFKQDYFFIALCTNGKVKMRINDVVYTFKKNSFTCLTEVKVVEILEKTKNFNFQAVFIRQDFITKDFSNQFYLEKFPFLFSEHPSWNFNQEQAELYIQKCNEIKTIMHQKTHNYKDEIAKNLILNLLYEIKNFFEENREAFPLEEKFFSNNASINIKTGFLELLKKHHAKERKVKFYADLLNISPRYLNVLLLQSLGQNTKKLIQVFVINEAKALLKTKKFNISQVANLLNFNNIEEFSRFFKNETKQTPRTYMQKSF